jgi:hypothetical protein
MHIELDIAGGGGVQIADGDGQLLRLAGDGEG